MNNIKRIRELTRLRVQRFREARRESAIQRNRQQGLIKSCISSDGTKGFKTINLETPCVVENGQKGNFNNSGLKATKRRMGWSSSDSSKIIKSQKKNLLSSSTSSESLNEDSIIKERSENIIETKKMNDYDDLKSFITNAIEKAHSSLSSQISQINGQIIQMKVAINELHDTVKDLTLSKSSGDAIAVDLEGDIIDPQITLPCFTEEDFKKFDKELAENVEIRSKMCQNMKRMICKSKPLVKNTSEMLRFCLSRDVASKYNLKKSTNGKSVFKETFLYKIIKSSIIEAFSKTGDEISEENVENALRSNFHQCKDWDGGRLLRMKKDHL